MDIYKQKQRWKIWLALTGLVIVAATMIYSNYIINRIAQEERTKVKLWAEAIQKRAELVSRTAEIFRNFEKEDRQNISLWAEATVYVATEEFGDLQWALKILSNNTTIPVFITDANKRILFSKNFPDSLTSDTTYMRSRLEGMSNKYPPLDVSYKLGDSLIKQYLYYDDTKIYSDLKETIEDLVESFISETVINSASVPVVFTNQNQDSVISSGNIDDLKLREGFTDQELISAVRGQNEPIVVDLGNGRKNFIFYRDSYIISLLKYFPFILLAIVSGFLLVAYLLFSTARRSEQNQVWVGLSKETAHQLGTPITSLMGWVEILKLRDMDQEVVDEIGKDIWRLQTVTERFSKIGSQPELKEEDLYTVLSSIMQYMEKRASHKIKFEFHYNLPERVSIPMNKPLFEWVIENLTRNSIDAINGPGSIIFEVSDGGKYIIIDVTDSGKGIPKNRFKEVFRPGYTTKKRGWGLGLSLTRRIIKEYHKGKIFVKQSEPGKGTTFRILMRE